MVVLKSAAPQLLMLVLIAGCDDGKATTEPIRDSHDASASHPTARDSSVRSDVARDGAPGGTPPRAAVDAAAGVPNDASPPENPDAPVSQDSNSDGTPEWQLIVQQQRATLLGVHGQSSSDVWMVGADDGTGPLLLHYGNEGWARIQTGLRETDLWWVRSLGNDELLLSGSRGTVAIQSQGRVTNLNSPGQTGDRVWGVWGTSTNELYAVGSSPVIGGFLWHYNRGTWEVIDLPPDVPAGATAPAPGLYKVWGASPTDIWVVGESGTVLRGNATVGFKLLPSRVTTQLVGLAGNQNRVWTVGGEQTGVLLEWDFGGNRIELSHDPDVTVTTLQGAFVERPGQGWASGFAGGIYRIEGGTISLVETELDVWPETFHTVWEDPDGGVWIVGGDVFTTMEQGVAVYYGPPIARYDRL